MVLFKLVALIGERFFVHHSSEIDSIVNFLFLVNQRHQTIKNQTSFIKHESKKWTINLENEKIQLWNSSDE